MVSGVNAGHSPFIVTDPRLRIDQPFQGDSHVDSEILQVPDFGIDTSATNSPAGFAPVPRSAGGPLPAQFLRPGELSRGLAPADSRPGLQRRRPERFRLLLRILDQR